MHYATSGYGRKSEEVAKVTHHQAQAREEESLTATRILMEEHRVIERALNALARLSVKLGSRQTPPESVLTDATDFIAGFADACHHGKEEHKLFPMLATVGMLPTEGPISVMLTEHEQGRAYNREMRATSARLFVGDEGARQQLVDAISGYIALLRLHIKKEDNALFPMADRLLSEDQQAQLIEQFDQVEREEMGEGKHEEYLAMLQRVEKAGIP